MSLEDDIARQAFHVEQLEQQEKYLNNCLRDMTLHLSRRNLLYQQWQRISRELNNASDELRLLNLLLPLSAPPDPRWGR